MPSRDSEDVDYRIDDLLYLVDWKPYFDIIGGANREAIIDIYIYRIWLYNYIFRRSVSDVDEIAKPMLYQLVNEIKTVGNPVFVETMLGTNTSRKRIQAMADKLMAKIYKQLDYYDSIATKYKDQGKDLEAVLLHLALQIGLKPMDDEDDAKKVSQLQQRFNDELVEPVSEVVLQATKNA